MVILIKINPSYFKKNQFFQKKTIKKGRTVKIFYWQKLSQIINFIQTKLIRSTEMIKIRSLLLQKVKTYLFKQMSIIQKFFTMSPFILRKIQKPANVINELSPNLYQNLRDSSKEFINGILNKDSQFLRQVTAKSLGDRLVQEIQQRKDEDFVQKFNLSKHHFQSAEAFYVSPYVIFGENFQLRIQRQKIWEDIRPLTSNRFIKMLPEIGFMQRFNQFKKKQIFGFHCFYEPLLVDVSQNQRQILQRPYMITFETDSNNIDPFIVDCQGSLFQDWRASRFR